MVTKGIECSAKVSVTFDVDRSGILNVSAEYEVSSSKLVLGRKMSFVEDNLNFNGWRRGGCIKYVVIGTCYKEKTYKKSAFIIIPS